MRHAEIVAFVLCGAAAPAQGLLWQAVPAATVPPARNLHAFFRDAGNGGMVVFGGGGTSGPLADSWLFRPSNGWSQLAPAHSPPGGFVFAAYQRGNGDMMILASDLTSWRWTGSDWVPVATTGPQPPPLGGINNFVAAAYDGDRDDLVYLLGANGTPFQQFELQGTRWHTASGGFPVLATYAAAAWWPGHGIIAHGGIDLTGSGVSFPTETWLLDATGWSRLAVSGPFGYHHHSIVWHPTRQRLVMRSTAHVIYEWQAASASWVQVGTGTLAFDHTSVPHVYDPEGERILAFGTGYFLPPSSQLDALVSATPARLDPRGSGCTGTAGVPRIGARNDSRPWLGDLCQVELTDVPAGAPLVWMAGATATWNQQPAPVDLSSLGMPGCFAEEDALVPAFQTADANGTAVLGLLVHDTPTLQGQAFFLQVVAMDPGANALGLVVSNALRGEIGRR